MAIQKQGDIFYDDGNKPIHGYWIESRKNAILQVAPQFGLSAIVGFHRKFGSENIEDDYEITIYGGKGDLGDFWRAVDKICPPRVSK